MAGNFGRSAVEGALLGRPADTIPAAWILFDSPFDAKPDEQLKRQIKISV